MQRVAVGRRLGGGLRADIAAGAGAVLHHDVLAPGLGELLRDDAAERVDGAAGRERDDHAHRAVGIALRFDARVRSDDGAGGHRDGRGPSLVVHSGSSRTPGFGPGLAASVHHPRRETQRVSLAFRAWREIASVTANRTDAHTGSEHEGCCDHLIIHDATACADRMRGLALPGVAAAQYPDKPIRLIVPQAPGSATDVLARLLAAELAPQLGQTVVVDNRPGGALTLGLDLTAKSAPDGYTLCMGPIGALAITRHMVAKLPYDIERDFQPIALVSRGHLLLAVSTALPVNSVKELVEHAKKNPGALTNASSSNGSPGHVGGELFKFMTGTNILHVPYKGGAQAINDLIAGHVHLMFESLNSISSTAKSGKVRGLGRERAAALASVPRPADDRRSRAFRATTPAPGAA